MKTDPLVLLWGPSRTASKELTDVRSEEHAYLCPYRRPRPRRYSPPTQVMEDLRQPPRAGRPAATFRRRKAEVRDARSSFPPIAPCPRLRQTVTTSRSGSNNQLRESAGVADCFCSELKSWDSQGLLPKKRSFP